MVINSTQSRCRFWNLSIASIVILIFSNILLTIRLLHVSDLRNVNDISAGNQYSYKDKTSNDVVQPCLDYSDLRKFGDAPQIIYVNYTEHYPYHNINLKLGRWDAKLLYKMFDNIIVGDKFIQLSEKLNVCLATQSSLEKLASIVQVATHWRGPISTAVFAAGNDEYNLLLLYLSYLRKCFKEIREQVTFHLAFPKDRSPNKTDININYLSVLDCTKPESSLKFLLKRRSVNTIRWRLRNPYPQNHLRNLARKNCQSRNVFLTDVDIIPSYNLAEGLNKFFKNNICKTGLCAYVIPTYELDERVAFPHNKSDLLRLVNKGLARPFHQKVFIYNQYATNISRWQEHQDQQGPGGEIDVHVSHPVTNFEFFYEPFYVAADNVPPHDERFIGYGFTRNTQVYEMFMAGYEFQVLSPVFTCHWGLQLKRTRPPWRERQNTLNGRQFEIFKHEIFARYNKDPLNMIKAKSVKVALKKV